MRESEPGGATMVQVWEQVGEQVLGQDADVAPDVVIENKSGGNGRFIVSAPPLPLPVGGRQVDGCQRRHGRHLI